MPREKKQKYKQYKPLFFPFSEGIPWNLHYGFYISPTVKPEIWTNAVKDKNIILTLPDGDLISNFISLSVIEAISQSFLGKEIKYIANSEYSSLFHLQNLAKPSKIKLTQELLKQYPTPLFFDKKNNAYFNILYRYPLQFNARGEYPVKINKPIIQTIFESSLMLWEDNFVPNFRLLNDQFYTSLVNTSLLKNKSRIITVILDSINQTEDNLGWNINNLKEFAQLVKSKGFKVIVFTKNINAFYGNELLYYQYNINNILQILQKSWLVLSNNIQWLIITTIISTAKIISKQCKCEYDLVKNAEYIKAKNDIFTSRDLISPVETFEIIKGWI